MKYIRTKDGIFEIKATPQSNAMYSGSQAYRIYDHIQMVDRDVLEKDIIKQADTIEELCDCFIYSDEVFKNVIYNNFHALKILLKLRKNYVVYAAIWTDKGLIYVAKMNSKGELELL